MVPNYSFGENFLYFFSSSNKEKNFNEAVVQVHLTDLDSRSSCTGTVDNTPYDKTWIGTKKNSSLKIQKQGLPTTGKQ